MGGNYSKSSWKLSLPKNFILYLMDEVQHLKLFKIISIFFLEMCIDFFRQRLLNTWSRPTWRRHEWNIQWKVSTCSTDPQQNQKVKTSSYSNLKILISWSILTVCIIFFYCDILSLKREICKLAQEDCMSILKSSPCTVNWTSRIINFAPELVSSSLTK